MLASNFQKCCLPYGLPRIKESQQRVRWTRPDRGKLKLNIYVACFLGNRGTGFGSVVHDEHGNVQGAFRSLILNYYEPFVVECLTIREGLRFIKMFGFDIQVEESDSALAISAITQDPPPLGIHSIIFDIKMLFSEFSEKKKALVAIFPVQRIWWPIC